MMVSNILRTPDHAKNAATATAAMMGSSIPNNCHVSFRKAA